MVPKNLNLRSSVTNFMEKKCASRRGQIVGRHEALACLALILFGMPGAALANPQTSIPAPLLPTVKCIYDVLKSSLAVKSVDVYSIDNYRFGIEYVFKDEDGQLTLSDVELVAPPDNSAFLGDKIPREVSKHAMMAGVVLTSNLQLSQKCHLKESFDNLLPQPTARAAWRHIDLPRDVR